MDDGGLGHDEAAVLGDEGGGDHQPQRHPLHGIDGAPREPHDRDLRDPHRHGDAGGQRDVVRGEVERQEHDGREEVGDELLEGGAHVFTWVAISFMPPRLAESSRLGRAGILSCA